jgi:hypothetical protein
MQTKPISFLLFRCIPSGLLRAELERRDFNFPAAQVELFVEHQINGCCESSDAAAQVARWQVQKLQADVRKRATVARRREEASRRGRGTARCGPGREHFRREPHTGGCPSCGEGGHSVDLCPCGGPGIEGEGVEGVVVCSAFAVPADWQGRMGTVGDDADFWLAVDKGFERRSTTELKVEWFSLSKPDLYVWEREDTELESRRAAEGIILTACEGGYTLAGGERAKVLAELAKFREREAAATLQLRRGPSDPELCTVCKEEKGEDDEQVLCDSCDKGFHLECLDKENMQYPDNVFEDGVEWLCSECMEKAALSYEGERLSARDEVIRASKSGRVVQLPARYRRGTRNLLSCVSRPAGV